MIYDLLVTPEKLDSILREGLSLYRTREQRASARGALMDAATLCDALASEVLAQNSRSGRLPSKAKREIAAVFIRARNEIMRMRDRVEVPDE